MAPNCSACESTPLTPEQMQYVGLWVASDRYFSIYAEGRLEYKEKLGMGMHNRVESGFHFEGDTIKAMLSSWVVNQPPKAVDGQLTMVVDNITYHHRGPPVTYGRSNNWPAGIN
jgi:hypothetical protein